jgi:hypothetical protein
MGIVNEIDDLSSKAKDLDNNKKYGSRTVIFLMLVAAAKRAPWVSCIANR